MPAGPVKEGLTRQEEPCDAWSGGSIQPSGAAQNMLVLIRSVILRSPTAPPTPLPWPGQDRGANNRLRRASRITRIRWHTGGEDRRDVWQYARTAESNKSKK